jgi:hypothetical protein
LFGPLKVRLGGQIFQTDDELKCGVLNWLCSEDKAFNAAGISNFPGWWKEYVSIKEEYLEKEDNSGTYILFAKRKIKTKKWKSMST